MCVRPRGYQTDSKLARRFALRLVGRTETVQNESVRLSQEGKEVLMSIHLIHIRDRETRERAIQEMLNVRESWVSFPKDVFGVTDEHIGALTNKGIPFDYVSKTPANATSTPLQS